MHALHHRPGTLALLAVVALTLVVVFARLDGGGPPRSPRSPIPEPSIQLLNPATVGPSSTVVAGATAVAAATPVAGNTPTPIRVYLPFVVGPPALTPSPSATPGPTSTPAAPVVGPAATVAPSPTRKPIRITKLGLGVYDSGGALLPALDESRPSVILLMDPAPDFAREVRRRFPKAFLVGRIYARLQPLDDPSNRGAAFADRVAAVAVPLKGVINAWMSYNEIGSPTDPQSMVNYNAFQVAFANRLQNQYGIPAVCNNDGPRAIPAKLYPRYYGPAIAACKYFGFHIYPDKRFTSLRDPAAADQVFYYRKIYQALVDAGIHPGPFIATEVGLWDGWRGVTTDVGMGQDFTWLAEQMNHDPYVLGMAIYGLFADGRPEWDRFNVDHSAILQIVGDYNTEP